MGDWMAWAKILSRLMYPSTLVLLLLFLAFILLLIRRYRSAGLSLLIALALVFLGSSPLVSDVYYRHERQYPPIPIAQSPTADAIVLLAGDISIPIPPRVESQIRGNRSVHTLRLYRAGKAPLIIISGGNVFPQEGFRPEAAYTADLLQEWGIPQSAIIFEGNSRNTRENAMETSRLLKNRQLNRVLLVTSAFHMPRALATFRGLDIDAIPSPSSISAELAQPTLLNWIPSLDGLGTMQSVVHEKVGIFVYRMRGWIDA
jgi:uncharacterized SAM-binding protein YcdF (DUF218 family)